ncbi:MAG TPA: ABC transporter substrate-binding protein [Bryobacteraceae bacterium]|jgi:peptide/nickel transport system substrate-binding protein|nr:ABC transporter substrate-binding protein [Bryobacteraceae bacterium]
MKLMLLIFLAGQLRFALHDEPKTTDPLLMADESAEAIGYLTEGVLIRINRLTQKPEPELATSWKISKDSTKITFQLRPNITSDVVVKTFERLLDPALHSPIADTFKTEKGTVKVTAQGPSTVTAEFPAPTASIEIMFDQVAIGSGLGPFVVAERKPGVFILLKKNPAYWKKPLPQVDTIRIDIEQNRDLELLRFKRGEIQLIDKLTPDLFERIPEAVDAGPTLDSEFLWFNQAKRAPIQEHTKDWFRSAAFRHAVSQAIQRADLCRVVYRGHATPAVGPIAPSNKLWFKEGSASKLDPLKLLISDGFHLENGVLRDRAGNAVEFSLITNAGSKTRERMAAMIQEDLSKLGIKINIVTLDFPSLIERMTRTLNYEACLLGLVNVDPDPSEMMNILLSSASNHPWNPSQKTPETPWEAEIDRLMLAQAATADYHVRKKNFDRVQEILREQEPIIYLLHPNSLSAVSKQLIGVKPTTFFPHTFWDAEHITVGSR